MAEGEEKTEQPTEKKRSDARKRGQVAISQEVSSTASVAAAFLIFYVMWDYMMQRATALFELSFDTLTASFREGMAIVLHASVETFAIITLIVIIATALAGTLGTILQIGLLIATENMKPSLNKLNPMNYFKRVFSKKGLLELGKTFLKLGVLGTLFYIVLSDKILLLIQIPAMGKEGILIVLAELLQPMVLMTIAGFGIIAAADFILQRAMLTKELMMSMQEIKQEYKESEGNPEIKGQRKQLHQELVMSDADDRVQKSNVLVTNPVHLAIALYYKAGITDLPIIMMMGEAALATRMKKVAEDNNIPIIQNVPLARGLYAEGKINHYIPKEFIEPVAEVLRWVKQLEIENELERNG